MNSRKAKKESALTVSVGIDDGTVFLWSVFMENSLQQAAQVYSEICKHRYRYTFSNGEEITVVFKPQNFCHLAGLRKINDLREFQVENKTPVYSANKLFSMALHGAFPDHFLQMSVAYDTDARERINNLSKLKELLHTDKAVWNFDSGKGHIKSALKSSVILFRAEGYNFYLTLGLADAGTQEYYPETFFLRYDTGYLENQEIVNIVKWDIE